MHFVGIPPRNPARELFPDVAPEIGVKKEKSVQPELRSFRERLFSRGGAGIAEEFLEIAESKGFALSPLQSFRWNFRFQVQSFLKKALRALRASA
jgi:hypothetical protein